jgi:integrase
LSASQCAGREWLELQASRLTAATLAKAEWTLTTFVFPQIGSRPIGENEPAEVLRLLKRIESRGKRETAHRTRQRCSQILRFAVASGRARRDATVDLRGALAAVKTESFAAIVEPKRIGELLRAIDGYQGHPAVTAALKLAPYVFVRPGGLRAAEWAEIDVSESAWRISAERMKMKSPHVVPLARRAVAI